MGEAVEVNGKYTSVSTQSLSTLERQHRAFHTSDVCVYNTRDSRGGESSAGARQVLPVSTNTSTHTSANTTYQQAAGRPVVGTVLDGWFGKGSIDPKTMCVLTCGPPGLSRSVAQYTSAHGIDTHVETFAF